MCTMYYRRHYQLLHLSVFVFLLLCISNLLKKLFLVKAIDRNLFCGRKVFSPLLLHLFFLFSCFPPLFCLLFPLHKAALHVHLGLGSRIAGSGAGPWLQMLFWYISSP